jgi:putative glutamine amidotransferase
MLYIGITQGFFYPDSQRPVFSHKNLGYLLHDLAAFVARPGVMPILIPDLPEARLMEFLDELDGIVFQGGSDVSPKTYHEEAIENGRWQGDYYRDQFELKILDYAYHNKKPVLAICRGMQLANVYFGGTLYQDLGVQTNTPIEHRNAEFYDKIFHSVVCTSGGLLERLYGKTQFDVNTVHHQGVKSLGENLVVDAICPEDNLIEAFHYKDLSEFYLFALQWHPEFNHTLSDRLNDPELILNHFLEAVRQKRKV